MAGRVPKKYSREYKTVENTKQYRLVHHQEGGDHDGEAEAEVRQGEREQEPGEKWKSTHTQGVKQSTICILGGAIVRGFVTK